MRWSFDTCIAVHKATLAFLPGLARHQDDVIKIVEVFKSCRPANARFIFVLAEGLVDALSLPMSLMLRGLTPQRWYK